MKITSKKIGGQRVYSVRGYLGSFTDRNGKQHAKNYHKGNFNSSEAAKFSFIQAQAAFQKQKEKAPVIINQRPTFSEVYQIWLQTYRLGVKESSLNRVIGIFKHHILPSLGSQAIDTISWQQCQQAVLTWRKHVVAFNKLSQYAALVFRTAQKMGVIDTNPMKLVDLPPREKDKKPDNYWTADELGHFLTAVDQQDQIDGIVERGALFYLLATTGMRKGEALALKWSDLDFLRRTVTINKTVTRKLDNSEGIDTPKTVNSNRTLSLEPLAISHLKVFRASMPVIPMTDSLVFTSSRDPQRKKPMSLMTPNHWLETIITDSGLPRITVHGLRHTFASIQIASGIEPKALQLQLGHSDIKVTLNVYTHMNQKQVAANVREIGDVI